MMGAAVRLQYDADLPAPALSALLEELELQPEDLYTGQGFTTFSALIQLYSSLDLPRLKDHLQSPLPVRAFEFGAARRIVSSVPLGERMLQSRYGT